MANKSRIILLGYKHDISQDTIFCRDLCHHGQFRSRSRMNCLRNVVLSASVRRERA